MKTLEEIIKQHPIYLNNWSNKVDMIADFEGIDITYEKYITGNILPHEKEYHHEEKEKMDEAIKKYEKTNILLASYGTPLYEGSAYVLFEEDGKLYEIEASHCSCYGLEDQWIPNEVSLTTLEYRLLNGTFGRERYSENCFYNEICDLLGVEKQIL